MRDPQIKLVHTCTYKHTFYSQFTNVVKLYLGQIQNMASSLGCQLWIRKFLENWGGGGVEPGDSEVWGVL